MSEDTLIALTMYAFDCNQAKAKSIISGARQSGKINDLIIYVRFKR